jgi:glycosyltransferase involved in cell wall biosynthesis
MRLAVYTDYSYRQDAANATYGERAFVLFLAQLAPSLDGMLVLGRLDPRPGAGRYRLPDDVRYVPLPHYESQLQPLRLATSLSRSLARFWRALDEVDAVWLLGPHPVALGFAVLARLRGRRVVLGVRQDLPAYTRSRHPRRRWAHLAADLLDAAWRLLARRLAVVVVGPGLARRYRRARRLLELSVSLVREREIVALEDALARSYDGELVALSVGRLETEKNPLLLADALKRLSAGGRAWRLAVCGEGPLAAELEQRLRELGVADRAELRGYVPHDELGDLYRGSHAFLHVSWTEGLPQVLFEAFAAGCPVVATDVGGVAEAVADAALLVPAGDVEAAAGALQRVAEDGDLRRRLMRGGLEIAAAHTIESESRRLLGFLRAA